MGKNTTISRSKFHCLLNRRVYFLYSLGHGIGAKLTSADSEFEKLNAENLSTITSYSDNLMEVICRDACDGHDIGRVISHRLLLYITVSHNKMTST